MVVRILLAVLAPGAGHIYAGRLRRGLFWVALILLSMLTVWWTPWLPLVLTLATMVDAGFLTEGDRPARWFLCCVATYVLLVGGALLLRASFIEMFKIPSGSSIPTLLVGDHVAVDKTVHQPRRGELDVFIYPANRDVDFIKRVIAVGGDTIEIRDNVTILNGQPVPRVHVEGDCTYDDYREEEERWEKRKCDAWDETLDGHTYRVIYDLDVTPRHYGPRTVPPGKFFVMGDNRDNSSDSRVWGFVPDGNLKGRAKYIWWSSGPEGIRWSRLQKHVP
jgi:signal peptidase I